MFWFKVAFACAVAVVGLASTYVPWLLGRRGSSERLLGLSNTFAAGVLGGAGVIHLLGAGTAHSTRRSAMLFEAVFDSIGAGTFMYIAALDIIKTEFDHQRDHAQKWLAAAAGFGFMALLAIWI